MNPDNDPDVYGSHAGEDEWILEQFPPGFIGTALEVGAHDGRYMSNTWLLEQRGWTVLCIEPNPTQVTALRIARKLVFECACSDEPAESAMLYVDPGMHMGTCASLDANLCDLSPRPAHQAGQVVVRTIDECLRQVGFTRLDALSIDVDGYDYRVLLGAAVYRWMPRVVVIEDNPESARVRQHILPLGYREDSPLGHNLCFVRTE